MDVVLFNDLDICGVSVIMEEANKTGYNTAIEQIRRDEYPMLDG